MAEMNMNPVRPVRKRRHRDRLSQIPIYLGKQFRFFINESDWKVIPMAAIIAALVGMVIRKRLFITMEGSLIGAFALACVGIWNGCFNSIQSICRERAIIKREHRSGMHVSSYIVAHMIYQLMLCLLQTGVTMYVLQIMDVKFPPQGFMTPMMILDVGISMLFISYASDMLSLFISSMCHTTTAAMTIMPFVLIFQLVFSGGIIPLPEGVRPLSKYTISTYGIKVIAAQSGYNELPMMTAWNTLDKMRDNVIGGTVTLGEILDLMKSPAIEKRRDMEIVKSFTVGEVADIVSGAKKYLHLRDRKIMQPIPVKTILSTLLDSEELKAVWDKEITPAKGGEPAVTFGSALREAMEDEEAHSLMSTEIGADISLGQVLDALHAEEAVERAKDHTLNPAVTLGQVIDLMEHNEALQNQRDRTFTFKTTVNELFDLVGEDKVKDTVLKKTSATSYNPEYERTVDNVVDNWILLGFFALVFALLATISLELIDKDKR